MTELCRLMLVLPESLEDEVIDALLNLPELIEGFTSFTAEGHGQDFSHAHTRERVRGRIGRKVVWLVLHRQRAQQTVDCLKKTICNADAVWWIEPVDEFGRLA